MLSSSEIHVTKTVDELLFSGYEDSLINLGRMAAMGEEIPPFDKFGWFYMVGVMHRELVIAEIICRVKWSAFPKDNSTVRRLIPRRNRLKLFI